MSWPISVDILSDSDSDNNHRPTFRKDAIDLTTPPLLVAHSKKVQRTGNLSNPIVFIIDDDPTRCKLPPMSFAGPKFSSTPSSVPDDPVLGCLNRQMLRRKIVVFRWEINPLICVESDDESENVGGFEAWKNNETVFAAELANESEFDTTLSASSFLLDSSIELQKKFSMGNADIMQMSESDRHLSSLEGDISTVSSQEIEISYVLIIYEAEDFCNLIFNQSLMGHAQSIQHHYPHHTICYLTNRLMAYIDKSVFGCYCHREQRQYKIPINYSEWKRPPIEEFSENLCHSAWDSEDMS